MAKVSATDQNQMGYLFAGFACLLASAFIDNSRGPVLPVLCAQLKIPYETAGLFLMLGNLAAVLMTFGMGRLLPKVGERKMAIFVCWFAIIPGLLAPFIEGRGLLLILGLLLGATVALVGSLSSILTIKGSSLESRGRLMSIQQGMYGVGSFAGPFLFSALIHAQLPWWWLFSGASLVTFILGLVFIWILPRENLSQDQRPAELKASLADSHTIRMLFIFGFYVAGEVLASMWMSSLMVGKQGLAPEAAAQYQMGFFLLIGLTRILCFVFVRPAWEKSVLIGCLLLGSLFALVGQQGSSWALPLIGLLGPFFPLTMARISIQFPETWKSMLIYIYLAIQAVLALMHLTVGKIADSLGIEQAFLLAPGFLIICLILLIPSLKQSPKQA